MKRWISYVLVIALLFVQLPTLTMADGVNAEDMVFGDDASINALTDTYITFPMSTYPAGSYFTNNNGPCTGHGSKIYTNCKSFASTNQCDGFARYVNQTYYHVGGSAWSSPYAPAACTTSSFSKYQAFGTETNLKNFFSTLTRGAYVRVSKRNAADDQAFWAALGATAQGSHSFVYVSHNASGAYLYEANLDDDCGVSYNYRTYTDLLHRYPYFFGVVNHNNIGSVVNSSDDYHRRYCSGSGCTAYIVEPHAYVSYGTQYKCTVCNDITSTPGGNIIMGTGNEES